MSGDDEGGEGCQGMGKGNGRWCLCPDIVDVDTRCLSRDGGEGGEGMVVTGVKGCQGMMMIKGMVNGGRKGMGWGRVIGNGEECGHS